MEPPTVEPTKTEKTQRFLSHWGIWMAIAYIALAAITITGFVWNSRTVKKEAVTRAAIDRCLAQRPILKNFSEHVKGVNQLANILVQNSQALIAQTRPSDPQYLVRVANLERLERARNKVAALKSLPVQTEAQCRRTG
jgi:hypothetical protein